MGRKLCLRPEMRRRISHVLSCVFSSNRRAENFVYGPKRAKLCVGAPRMVRRAHHGSNSVLTNRNTISGECSQHSRSTLCRGAENRTRSLRTRSVCTTGILRPDKVLNPKAHVLPVYYSPSRGREYHARMYSFRGEGLKTLFTPRTKKENNTASVIILFEVRGRKVSLRPATRKRIACALRICILSE